MQEYLRMQSPKISSILKDIGALSLASNPLVPDGIKDKLSGMLPSDQTATMLHAMCASTYMRAIVAEPWAVNFVADRLEGKPKMSLAIDTEQHAALLDKIDELVEVQEATVVEPVPGAVAIAPPVQELQNLETVALPAPQPVKSEPIQVKVEPTNEIDDILKNMLEGK